MTKNYITTEKDLEQFLKTDNDFLEYGDKDSDIIIEDFCDYLLDYGEEIPFMSTREDKYYNYKNKVIIFAVFQNWGDDVNGVVEYTILTPEDLNKKIELTIKYLNEHRV